MKRFFAAFTGLLAVIVGAAGLLLTQQEEGLKLRAYRDPVGILTVCYGHTGADVDPTKLYTKDECYVILIKDIGIAQTGLKACGITGLNQNQLDATADFALNVGVRKACESTLARKLRARDFLGASLEFNKWRYADGKVMPGIVRRRARETKLFNAPVVASGLPVSMGNVAWASTGATKP